MAAILALIKEKKSMKLKKISQQKTSNKLNIVVNNYNFIKNEILLERVLNLILIINNFLSNKTANDDYLEIDNYLNLINILRSEYYNMIILNESIFIQLFINLSEYEFKLYEIKNEKKSDIVENKFEHSDVNDCIYSDEDDFF